MKKMVLGFALVSVVGLNAMAGVVVCKGDKHTLTIDSAAQTVLLSPEMSAPVIGTVGAGPEENTYIATDATEQSRQLTFLLFMGVKRGQIKANLFVGNDNSEPEAMTCTGVL